MSIFFTSSLYHICKFGSEDTANPNGICFILPFETYFVLDHLFATLTIPCLLLSFAPLDVVIYYIKDFMPPFDGSNNNNKSETNGKKFVPCDSYDVLENENEYQYYYNTIFLPQNELHMSKYKEEALKFINEHLFSNDKSFQNNSNDSLLIDSSQQRYTLKPNMQGLETLYICIYGYLVAISLIISYPNMFFIGSFIVSSFLISLFWGIYYYVKYKILMIFEPYKFTFGLLLSALACFLMVIQDQLPSSSYWITHSIWHVCGATGQFLLLMSKHRYLCYYYNNNYNNNNYNYNSSSN